MTADPNVDQVGVCETCRYDLEHIVGLVVAGQEHGPFWKHLTPRPHLAVPILSSVRDLHERLNSLDAGSKIV